MTRTEALKRIDDNAVSLAEACKLLGIVSVFIRNLDDHDEHSIRLIGPDTLLLRPMIEAAVRELKQREEAHRC